MPQSPSHFHYYRYEQKVCLPPLDAKHQTSYGSRQHDVQLDVYRMWPFSRRSWAYNVSWQPPCAPISLPRQGRARRVSGTTTALSSLQRSSFVPTPNCFEITLQQTTQHPHQFMPHSFPLEGVLSSRSPSLYRSARAIWSLLDPPRPTFIPARTDS